MLNRIGQLSILSSVVGEILAMHAPKRTSATGIPVSYRPQNIIAGVLILIFAVFQPASMGLTALAQSRGGLSIVVLERNSRVVNKEKELRLVVEVRNDSKVPVAGADVTFIAPQSGPGILFAENAS